MFVHRNVLVAGLCTLAVFASLGRAGEPPAGYAADFKHARIVDAWKKYEDKLTFGGGQTLALVDDGCKLSMPEWAKSDGKVPKVRVTYDSVDGDDDPKHEGRGYHGSTIGIPSSLNYKGQWGVAYNNQVAVIRALECCHCNVKDGNTLAAGLQWIIDHHKKHNITTVNLAPVDDLEHDQPVPTAIDDKLKTLRKLGIWVSAPTGNHAFTKGISWPACQPDCFAIGAVRPGRDEVFLDRSDRVVLVVPASATSSSNAIACGAAMLLREAIEKTGYDWKKDGPNLPEAMLAIMQRTGPAVVDKEGGQNRTFRRLDVLAALDEVFAKAPNASAEAEAPLPTSRTPRTIAGWNVKVDDRLLQAPNEELGKKALFFLESKLNDIIVVVPAEKLKKLQAVTIVLDLTHGKLRPMQYHPSAGWLKDNGYAADLAKCVHLPRAFDVATKRNINEQPWVILHELAHAYHDQVLGFEEPRVKEAFEKYKKSGRGDKTLLFSGNRVRHYALTNQMEFFAEMTEAYFGSNDFFPFNRAELRESEPEIFQVLADVWDMPKKKTP